MRRPRFIALQARNARGPVGWIIAWIMAMETRHDNLRAIDALDLRPADHVLDVGTGHGSALAVVAARARDGIAIGIDPSPLMVKIATRRSAKLIHQGRARVQNAEVSSLPFPGASIDKAMAVHVLYFWPDLTRSLGEIGRVLKPGGRLALLFRSGANKRAVASFPADVYRFRELGEITSALEARGFVVDHVDSDDGQNASVMILATKR